MLLLRVDPRPVAVARIGLGIAALINTLELYFILSGLAAGKLAMPLFGWAPQVTPTVGLVALAVGVTAAVSLILGVGTSAAAAAYSLTTATVLVWDQQTYSSHQVVVVLLIAILAFAQSDKAFSIVRRPGHRSDVPWWPQLLMMTQLTALYLFAGLSKINPEFLSGDSLALWMRWPLPGWLFEPMAVATILTEVLVLAIGLWVPRCRVISAAVGICLHVSIVTLLADNLLQLIAFALACIPLYPLFLFRPNVRPAAEAVPEPARRFSLV